MKSWFNRYNLPVSAYYQAAALLIACAAAWPLMNQAGLLNTRGGGDSPFLLQRLHQLVTALADGHFPVRWMPDANYGYGYPFYNYYAPLSIYITALFHFIGFSFVRAIQLSQLAAFLTAAWATFHLGRRWLGSDWAGLLASAAYTLAPFHMVNVYVRGDSLAEFWAMAFYPLVFLAVDRLSERLSRFGRLLSDRVGIVLLALAFAGLVLSHNISALIFTPFLLFYVISAGWRLVHTHQRFTAKDFLLPLLCLLALAVGLALSAWFWLPALHEQSLAQLAPVTAGYFHFSNHFRGLDLVQTSFLFNYDVAGGHAFRMGLIQAITTILGLAILITKNNQQSTINSQQSTGDQKTARFPAPLLPLFLLLATFMITPLSWPLWENLPLLSFTQFPWRFLSVQAFFAAMTTAAIAWLPGRRLIVPAVVALLLLAALGNLRTDHLILKDSDVTAERLAQYEWFTGNIGSTVSAEYLPHYVQPRPYTSPWLNEGNRNQVQVVKGVASAQLVDRWATRQSWLVQVDTPQATVTLPTLHWAGWQAAVAGQEITIRPAAGSGLITLDLPAGEHNITIRLARTPIRGLAELLSLTAVFLCVWLVWPANWTFTLAKWQKRVGYTAVTVLLLALLLRFWPQSVLSVDSLSWDFEQMGYLHHAPAGIPFDNGATLQTYHYSVETIRAGETFSVTVTWATSGAGETMLALTTPAVTRFGQAPVISSQTESTTAGETTYQLMIPKNAPAGLYTPRLALAGSRPLTPSGQSRGVLFLRPLRVTNGQTETIPVAESNRPVQVRVEQLHYREWDSMAAPAGCLAHHAEPSLLDVQLSWLAVRPLSHNYNISLRLTDNEGLELAQCDSQPGYGFQPSNNWPAGQWVHDWLALALPSQLPDNYPYGLMVRLYEVETGTAVLTRRLGELDRSGDGLTFRATEPVFTLPDTVNSVAALFGDVIRLRGYQIDQEDQTINLTLYWEAVVTGQEDFTHFVHLIDRQSGLPVTQHDAMPRHNSYPTSQWTAGEIVADPLTLDLTQVPDGDYTIVVGLYRNIAGLPRLAAVDEKGQPLPSDQLFLPEQILISR